LFKKDERGVAYLPMHVIALMVASVSGNTLTIAWPTDHLG
jgi:hypothetical protein